MYLFWKSSYHDTIQGHQTNVVSVWLYPQNFTDTNLNSVDSFKTIL